MKIRGERECQACGARWSYYETGSVACPSCGSLRSVGVDGRTAHTDAPATLALGPHRERIGDARGTLPAEGVDELKSTLREYVRQRGFIRGGELLPIDPTYLAARELLEAVDAYEALIDPADADRAYLLALLAGAEDGDRPAADDVPVSLREARGMADARAIEEYRDDLLAFLDELAESDGPTAGTASNGQDGAGPADASGVPTTVTVESGDGADPTARIAPAREALERLRDRAKRVEALQGDVDPAMADRLVDAAIDIGEYVRSGNENALATARTRLDGIADREAEAPDREE